MQAYIKHFAPEKGNIVLDPFGGSGVTAIEAIVLGRKAIHVDINPLANFICHQIAVAPVDLVALRNAFVSVEESCRPYIDHLYTLSDSAIRQQPLYSWYPKGIQLPKNADAKSIEELFTYRQLLALSTLYEKICKINDPITRDLIRFAFSATLNKCNLTYSTTKGRSEGRGNSGIMHTYRYWIPKAPVELNVWNEFAQKFRNLVKVKKETNQVIGMSYNQLHIAHKSATQLTDFINPETVDYVFTDPPYGSHIAYLDLSTMWNAWLGFDITPEQRKLEAIEGGDLDKSIEDYAQLLHESLDEMFEVLKWNGWLTIVFAHKDLSYWRVLIDAAQDAGFEYQNTVVQESFQFSRHKRANPLSVLSGELILNFQKKRKPRRIRLDKKIANAEETVLAQVKELISRNEEGLTTEEVYNHLVPQLLERGLLRKGGNINLLDLTVMLESNFHFDPAVARWYSSKSAALNGKKAVSLIHSKGQLTLGFPDESFEKF